MGGTVSSIQQEACAPDYSFSKWSAFLNFHAFRLQTNSDQQFSVHATFHNQAADPVSLYKVRSAQNPQNLTGTRAGFLRPGEKMKIDCAIGDTFTARSESPGTSRDQALLLAHDVARVYISDFQCPSFGLQECEQPPFSADSRWTPPDSFMFSNTLDASVDLFYVNEFLKCEEKVGTVSPGEDHHMQSTMGHHFRVRDPASRRLYQEYILSEIPIRALEEDEFEISEKAAALFDEIHLSLLENTLADHEALLAKLRAASSSSTCATT